MPQICGVLFLLYNFGKVWQESNLQSSDVYSDTLPLRYTPISQGRTPYHQSRMMISFDSFDLKVEH